MTVHQIKQSGISAASAAVATEVRVEMARQGINQTELARRMAVGRDWVSNRIGRSAFIDLKIDEAVEMAKALNVPVQGLLSTLPRLDSNQQPSG